MSAARKILVVHDDLTESKSWRTILEKGGFQIRVVTDFGAELDRTLSKPFDVAIIHSSVQGRSGSDIVRLVRRRWPRTHVIVTGLSCRESIPEVAQESDADDYLPKSLTPKELMEKVRRVLGASLEVSKSQTTEKGFASEGTTSANGQRAERSDWGDARVLLAGSDAGQMASIWRSLCSASWEMTTGETHEEVLERVRTGQVDVLVIGLDVFGVRASDLIARIRELDSRIPVIVASAACSREEVQRLRELGIFFHMVEPFEATEIRSVVRNATRRAQELRASESPTGVGGRRIRSLRAHAPNGSKVGFIALGQGIDEGSPLCQHVVEKLKRHCMPVRVDPAGGTVTAKELPRFLEENQKVVILARCNGCGRDRKVRCYSAVEFEKLAPPEQLDILREVAYPEVLHWLRAQGISPEVKIVCLPDRRLRSEEISEAAEVIVSAGLA